MTPIDWQLIIFFLIAFLLRFLPDGGEHSKEMLVKSSILLGVLGIILIGML